MPYDRGLKTNHACINLETGIKRGQTMSLLQSLGLAYIVTMNCTGFIAAYSDKHKSQKGKWRIPEKTFLLLSLFGSGIGVLAGFFIFRHKTKHAALLLGVIMITAVFFAVAIYVAAKSANS
jgi:uncharacterized membrane protein YsdA (DUF1294 family)